MGDPDDVKRQYRQFAETECKGYSRLSYSRALAVSETDALARFVADMPVTQPNLLLASVQLLPGPAAAVFSGTTKLEGALRFSDSGAFGIDRRELTSRAARLETRGSLTADHVADFTISARAPAPSGLTAWQERLGTQPASATVGAPDTKTQNFKFPAPAAK